MILVATVVPSSSFRDKRKAVFFGESFNIEEHLRTTASEL